MGIPQEQGSQNEALDATQTAILDAVLSCVAKYGFGGITTRRIANEAGVNEVTIFRRFGNKASLLKAAFQREASFVQAGAVYYTGNLEADLLRIVETLLQAANRRNALLPLIVAELAQNPEMRDAVQPVFQVIAQVTQVIQQYQTAGKLRPEPPMTTFTALVGPIMFAALLHLAMPEMGMLIQPQDYVHQFLIGRGVYNA